MTDVKIRSEISVSRIAQKETGTRINIGFPFLYGKCVLEDSKCSHKPEKSEKSMGFKFFYINWIRIGFGVGFKFNREVSLLFPSVPLLTTPRSA